MLLLYLLSIYMTSEHLNCSRRASNTSDQTDSRHSRKERAQERQITGRRKRYIIGTHFTAEYRYSGARYHIIGFVFASSNRLDLMVMIFDLFCCKSLLHLQLRRDSGEYRRACQLDPTRPPRQRLHWFEIILFFSYFYR